MSGVETEQPAQAAPDTKKEEVPAGEVVVAEPVDTKAAPPAPKKRKREYTAEQKEKLISQLAAARACKKAKQAEKKDGSSNGDSKATAIGLGDGNTATATGRENGVAATPKIIQRPVVQVARVSNDSSVHDSHHGNSDRPVDPAPAPVAPVQHRPAARPPTYRERVRACMKKTSRFMFV